MRKVLQAIQAPYYTVTKVGTRLTTHISILEPKKDRQLELDIQSNQMSQFSLSTMEKNWPVLSKKVSLIRYESYRVTHSHSDS